MGWKSFDGGCDSADAIFQVDVGVCAAHRTENFRKVADISDPAFAR
jgi:hypothetical protein